MTSNAGKKKWLSGAGLALVVGLFVLVNILGNALLNTKRIDLTAGGIYTLSEGTKKVLSEVAEPVTLRFFYSEEQANGYPVIQSYGSRLKGLLLQYQNLSGGKVKVEFINPQAFSEEEDLAVALGIADLPTDDAGNKLYFGLAASNSTDDRMAIPFFDPEKAPFIEYELTRMVHDLANPKKTKIGLMTWLPMEGGGVSIFERQGPWAIYKQMQESYDLEVLDKDTKHIPDDVDVLMVVHPDNKLSDDTLYAMDQFILKGGRGIFFTDPYTRINERSKDAPSSNLSKLYHAWGIDMPAMEVVADPAAAIRIQNEGRDSVLTTVSNPTWMNLQKGNFNPDEVISSGMEMMRFIVSGQFVPKPAEAGQPSSSLTMTPLVLSGASAATVSGEQLLFNSDPAQFMRDAKPIGGLAVLAARLSGTAHTAFPERTGSNHLGESAKPVNIVVVGDVDMLRDNFWMSWQNIKGKEIAIPNANNGSFVMNALDYLAGGGDLIGLRSRMMADRPFDRVDEMRLKAEGQFREQEDSLKGKLVSLQKHLSDLQSSTPKEQAGEGDVVLSSKQEEELAGFREQVIATRKELRSVQRSLRAEIETLGTQLKLLNIGLMPLLVLLLALIVPARLGMRRN